jgi:ssDNA-binding Zn-finger/Zn-ribbon topoisomerase 1
MNNIFKGLIRCKKCQKAMKYKKRDNTYICSTYDNSRGSCERVTVKVDFLKNLLDRRFDKDMSPEDIREVVEFVEVDGRLIFEIGIREDKNIICAGNFIQF